MVERAGVDERHPPIGEHKFLRLRDGEPDTFGLVVRVDGAVAAYAQATRFPPLGRLPRRLAAELLVGIEHRRRGFGLRLIDRLVDESRRAGVQRFDLWAHNAGAACLRLAESLGMYVSRALWQLSLELDAVPRRLPREALPGGVRLRSFVRGADEAAVVELIRWAFSDHPENGSWTADDLEQRAAQPWFDPTAILLAEADHGALLGLHWMKFEADTAGEVYLLGVAPGVQGHGLGRVLLLEGLEEMRRRGVHVAYLYVEADNDAAMRLYRDAGFRHEHLDTCYSLDLEAPAANGAAA